MNTATLRTALGFVFVSGFLLAGCSQKTAIDDTSPNNDVSLESQTVPVMEATTAPSSSDTSLSNSSEIDDLQKELDETTIETEDFNDL